MSTTTSPGAVLVPQPTTLERDAALALRRRASRRKRLRQTLWNAVGVVVFLIMFFPVYWMISTAFKPSQDILTFTPHWFPDSPTLEHFRSAVERANFWTAVRSTVVVTVSTVVIASLVALLAAVAVGRMEFRGRKAFILMILIIQMVPLNVMIISIYLLLNRAGQTDKLTGLIVVYLAFVLPFIVWVLRGFVLNVPRELEEAAMVDGCSRFAAFRRVTLPLILPGLVATSIFAFIQAWNEYLMAYIIITDQNRMPLTPWLALFTSQKGTEWGPLMAASVLTALPVVIFFLLINRKIASGLTAGAVKG
jgi:N,N'-diacetylchitobiose transport system permease protein